MPIREYVCPTCGHELELIEPMNAEPPRCAHGQEVEKTCPTKMEQKWSRTAPPKFVGSGFHETDYK